MRLGWLMLLGMAACSPYNFSSEVAAFSTGVDQVSAGFAASTAALATDRATQVQRNLIDARARIDSSPSCEVPVSKTDKGSEAPCLLYRAGGEPSQPSRAEVALQKGKIPLAALLDYSHALAAVTNAADRAAYDAAVAKLADSLKGLASAAGPSGAGMGTAVAAGVNILGWLVGTALDQQRFDSLKAAVNAVGMRPADGGDTPMKVITNAIGDGLEVANYQRLNTLNDEMNGDRVRLGPSLTDAAYRQRLDDALALATSIQALREADPRGTTDALNAAHEALVKAVNDPSRNLPALVKALTDFSDKAQALQTATSKAAAPQKGT